MREPDIPAASVEEQLAAILASKSFCRSERLRDFLTFVVRETMAGRGDQLKEYTIAADVFRRTDSYDPKSDALVRVEARRLRNKLKEYYAAEGRGARIVIELPKGSYKPVFTPRNGRVQSMLRRPP